MPRIGDIKKGSKNKPRLIWRACIDCGKERWVRMLHGKPERPLCLSCSKRGERSYHWKGGRFTLRTGYVLVQLNPKDFFFSMADNRGYVYEHRLVVAKSLGRCLQSWEIVHHKEGHAKDDNRYPETLQLVTDDRHKQITILENRIKYLEKRNSELQTRIDRSAS